MIICNNGMCDLVERGECTAPKGICIYPKKKKRKRLTTQSKI